MYIYIRSMSEAQSKIYDKVSSVANQIDMHVIKILMYPDSPFLDHWMHEIWAFLSMISKLKGSNKYPKASFIRKSLAVYNDTIEAMVALVQDEEPSLIPSSISASEIEQCLEEYQSWLASELSSRGFVRQADVKAKLKEICNV